MDAEENQIEYLKERYDAERDAGNMTWTDRVLLNLVESLLKKITVLEGRIEALENPDEGELSPAQAVQIASLAASWQR